MKREPENTHLTAAAQNNVSCFVATVTSWFKSHGRDLPWRHRSASTFRRIVCEILLQRTRAEVVASAYHAFFRRFPSWASLAQASTEEIGNELRPLGLWRRRSRSLHQLATVMCARRGRFPRKREEIDKLPAVGQYVANSIELFTRHEPRPLLDTNMARVLERYFGPRKLADIRHDPYLQELASRIISTAENPWETNWAILDFAALVCKKRNPLCNECPLVKTCRYLKS